MKKFVSLLVTLAMVFSLSVPAFAAERSANTTISIGDIVTQEDMAFFEKIESIFSAFQLDKDGKLYLSVTDEELKSNYDFTSSDLDKLNSLLTFQHEAIKYAGNMPSTRLHVEDWKIYFDLGDVHAFLFAAAQVGPAAIMAALSALGSVYPGVGTVVGAIVGLFGGGTIIYWVFQAVALEKGLYIGVDWNGPFPNPAIGLW